MGVRSSKHEDGFTKHTNDLSVPSKVSVVTATASEHLDTSFRDNDKLRVLKAKKILIIGDNRIKVATACYLRAYISNARLDVEIIVGTRDPDASKNSLLVRAGVTMIKADMNSPESLLPAIRKSGADTVFLVSPNQLDRSVQTNCGISACRRAGVGHVVVLSSTCAERTEPSIFGDQCKQIEAYLKTTRIGYTIVRIPILLDNYLSQLQSMSEYGIFYRPLPANATRNSVAISDVGAAVGTILLTPGKYMDKTISLNGPHTNCGFAAAAFTAAFNKPIIYEQVTYESYKDTLLESSMPEWQANGILELFKMFENREPFCQGSLKTLETILGRRPTTVYDLALSAIAKTRPRGPSGSDDQQSDFSKSEHGFMRTNSSGPESPDRPQNHMRSESLESGADEDSGIPYSRLKIKRSIDCAPSSSLSPAGIAGLLKVVMCMHGMNTSRSLMSLNMNADPSQTEDASAKPKQAVNASGEITRNLDQRYCILLDGIFTFLPPSVSTITGAGATPGAAPKVKEISDAVTKTRAVGSMENRSIALSGYVIRKTDDKKLSITGSKGEMTSYSLEAASIEDCHRWLAVLNAHVEHVDNKAGSKWIF